VEDLTRAFSFNDKKPRCLDQVLIESIQSQKLVGELDYRNSIQPDERGWVPWAVGLGFNYLVKKPVAMTFNWAWSSIVGSGTKEVRGSFVSREMVEEMAEMLFQRCNESNFRETVMKTGGGTSLSNVSSLDNAVEFDVLRRETAAIVGDEKTLSIILSLLHAKGKISLTKVTVGDDVKTYVVFDGVLQPKPSSTTLFSTPLKIEAKKELTEKDKSILQLEATAKQLTRQMEAILAEMTERQEEAKRYLAAGIKPLALNCLKRKKLLQSKLEAREKSLENIEAMISKLQDVDSNKMVFSAYKDAVAALNKSWSDTDIDSIEDTMDDMKEALEKQAEVGEALAGRNLRHDDDEDEDELESELERILNESDGESSFALPAVPSDGVEELLDKLCISPIREEAEKRSVLPQMAL